MRKLYELVLECGPKSSLRAVLRRSLWSITIDAVLQYCRIVFDIFSREKPISLVTFDNEEKIHSIWLDEDQSIEALWTSFTHEGPPVETHLDLKNCSNMPGLGAACSMLQMLKASQKQQEPLENGGRVIVISSFMEDQLSAWIPGIKSALNKPVDSTGYLAVTTSEWLFIDIVADQVPGEEARKFAPLPQRIEVRAALIHHFLLVDFTSLDSVKVVMFLDPCRRFAVTSAILRSMEQSCITTPIFCANAPPAL
ncbi:unnamed protein product [Dicrocoelium dendriticum]|nr:unnamed protein product [Dicrocoelium dendriticum]